MRAWWCGRGRWSVPNGTVELVALTREEEGTADRVWLGRCGCE